MAILGKNGYGLDPRFGDFTVQGSIKGVTIFNMPQKSLTPFTITYYDGEIPIEVKEQAGIVYDRFVFARFDNSPESLVIGGIAGNDSDYAENGYTLVRAGAKLFKKPSEKYHLIIGSGALGSEDFDVDTGTAVGTAAFSRARGTGFSCAFGTESGRYAVNTSKANTYNSFLGEYAGPYYSPASLEYTTIVGGFSGPRLDDTLGTTARFTLMGGAACLNIKRGNRSTIIGGVTAYNMIESVDTIVIGADAATGVENATNCTIIGPKNGFSATEVDTTVLGTYNRIDLKATADKVSVGVVDSRPTEVYDFIIANYSSLDFADDSAASNGGVALGGVYHTGGVLKIRLT